MLLVQVWCNLFLTWPTRGPVRSLPHLGAIVPPWVRLLLLFLIFVSLTPQVHIRVRNSLGRYRVNTISLVRPNLDYSIS